MLLDISVVVPVRNAEGLLDECLCSIIRCQPMEVIVVDGLSTDATLDVARRYPVRILSDGGRGLPAARMLGAQAARSRWVALIDADVVLPEGALENLRDEFIAGRYTALQAGLESVPDRGYWSRALAHHHRSGRSRHWFGLVATLFERNTLLGLGLDERFPSGEDVELRWRLERAGDKTGVSKKTIVRHRFESGFRFARSQWTADGKGLARMISKYGIRGAWLLGLPLAASGRGIALSLGRGKVALIPYFVCYLVFNYLAIFEELTVGRWQRRNATNHRSVPPEGAGRLRP